MLCYGAEGKFSLRNCTLRWSNYTLQTLQSLYRNYHIKNTTIRITFLEISILARNFIAFRNEKAKFIVLFSHYFWRTIQSGSTFSVSTEVMSSIVKWKQETMVLRPFQLSSSSMKRLYCNVTDAFRHRLYPSTFSQRDWASDSRHINSVGVF